MIFKEIRDEKIRSIKNRLANSYIYVMASILAIYAMVFTFYMKDEILFYYTGLASLLIIIGWRALRNRVKLDKLVAYYLVFAPLYNFYIIMRFWDVSAASFAWLIPIPFGAYIFFNNRIVVFYIIYTVFTIFVSLILSNFLNLKLLIPLGKVKISDVFVITVNIFLISFLVYFKNKIRELEIINEIGEKEKINIPISHEDKDVQMFDELFSTIENHIKGDEQFKDSNITISAVSSYLNINSGYISKAIRYKGFINFNHYINIHRINYTKSLLDNVDMSKLTLLYIYTESGFKSQATFNRVFKQIEGITPTEYIKNLKK